MNMMLTCKKCELFTLENRYKDSREIVIEKTKNLTSTTDRLFFLSLYDIANAEEKELKSHLRNPRIDHYS